MSGDQTFAVVPKQPDRNEIDNNSNNNNQQFCFVYIKKKVR